MESHHYVAEDDISSQPQPPPPSPPPPPIPPPPQQCFEFIREEDDRGAISEALRQEDEFLEYLMSLPKIEPRTPPAPETSSSNNEVPPKVGLDHLDNLCKLMEQLGDLREHNGRLQKRVQYLEDMRALQEMHRQLRVNMGRQVSNESYREEDVIKPEAIVIHSSNESLPRETNKVQTLKTSHSMRSRARSRSVGPEELPPPTKAKVSKWTRVKEAFRWEKAQMEPSSSVQACPPPPSYLPEAKSQDSGIGLGQGLLQVPGPRAVVESVSPADSVLSYSAPMSSSSEDLMDIDLNFSALSDVMDFGQQRSASAADANFERTVATDRAGRRRSLSPGPDEDATRRSKSLESNEEACRMGDKKHCKTPWGKVKNIIQTRRDSLKRHRGPHHLGVSDDEDEDLPPVRGQRSREPSGDKRPPMLTVTLPSTEELHSKSEGASRSLHSPKVEERRSIRGPRFSELQGARPKEVYRRQSSLPRPNPTHGSGTSPPVHRRPSKWTKVKKAFLTSRREEESGMTLSMPCSPHSSSGSFRFEAGRGDRTSATSTQAEIQQDYELLQSRLSQEFHKKLEEWERRKSGLGSSSVRDSVVTPPGDEELSKDFRKKLHEWERIKSAPREEEPPPPPPPPPPLPPPPRVHSHLSPQFRKRLLEWQIRRAVSGKAGPHEKDELHSVLPEDFTRKLQQWERIKAGKGSPRLSRKDSRNEQSQSRESAGGGQGDKTTNKSAHKDKQLQWLEKELIKVEREKRRLEREREKFLEREARLERMRRAIKLPEAQNEKQQEVLIQTSTGFFRFHGISEQFTRRLYEWEQQRGIAPEASTFALLDPKYRPEAGEEEGDAGSPGALVRCKSAGSVADTACITASISPGELVQSSSLSLNDVEALEAELGENRVSSEPRLRSDSYSKPRSRSNSRTVPRPRPPPPPPKSEEGPGVVVGRNIPRPRTLQAPPSDQDSPGAANRKAARQRAFQPPPPEIESPGAVIVDVEDFVEEAAPLVDIPEVIAEKPTWSYAPDEITQLIDSSGSEEGAEREVVVRRGDSLRSTSSYRLLEENMQLLGELKEKENICRKLESEMGQLEHKLQDVASTQQKQMERLKKEETDRSADYEDEEQQPPPVMRGEQVTRLRRSVLELGARRERLQRHGQALQDSFEEHSQQQAVLAQSLVGRMRMLRQGVAEETGVVPSLVCSSNEAPSLDVCPAVAVDVTAAGTRPQDPVAKVELLSSQLLSLAEKLEQALASRTREIQTLRFELRRGTVGGSIGRRDQLRPTGGLDANLSSSLSSLQARVGRDESLRCPSSGKAALIRQSSDEAAELPFLLTNKVLELKQGLSELCAKPSQVEIQQEPKVLVDVARIVTQDEVKETSSPQKETPVDEPETPTATFILRVGSRGKRDGQQPILATPLQNVASTVEGGGSPSPIASVTIRPKFWKRVPAAASGEVNEEAGRESPESSSSNESEGEEEEERGLSDKNLSDQEDNIEPKKLEEIIKEYGDQVCNVKIIGEILQIKPQPVSEEAKLQDFIETPPIVDEDASHVNNPRRCSIRRSKHINEENRDSWRQHQYVTTVSASATTAESKKLKTRRVSDTHIAYKSQESSPTTTTPSDTSPPVNVFVPTTRKIFSPVQGKSESVIGYVVSETGDSPERTSSNERVIPPWRRRGSAESENTKTTVIPWRRTRDSQSASPALPRKILAGNFSPDSSPRPRRMLADATKNEFWPPSPLPPPFPRSPTPNRRDVKVTKEAAPSIKFMIAKYNQKMGENPSPEVRSPTCSPAWRSPVAERRDMVGMVRAQMERYQEEIRRGLQDGFNRGSVQKSASAGVIRFPGTKMQPPPLLKSSSAGTIKSPVLPFKKFVPQPPQTPPPPPPPPPATSSITPQENLTSPLDQSIDATIQTYRKNPPSPRPSTSPHSPCLRALKIKRAKEEFLSRGPGGLSTSESAGCRLSQASGGSGSSFEDLLVANEGIVKSASVGMIHVQASAYQRLAPPEEESIRNSEFEVKSETKSTGKFGLAGLTSKFRKVRLRKKERLNTVSLLCRQSLLVDLNDRGGPSTPAGTSSTASGSLGPETKSCPSSPVLSQKRTWTKKM